MLATPHVSQLNPKNNTQKTVTFQKSYPGLAWHQYFPLQVSNHCYKQDK